VALHEFPESASDSRRISSLRLAGAEKPVRVVKKSESSSYSLLDEQTARAAIGHQEEFLCAGLNHPADDGNSHQEIQWI